MSGMTSHPRPRRALLLAAHAAAGAFCRRHLKRLSPRRASAWTPVLLRWRKEAGARAGAALRFPGRAGLWTSQFHLHFHLPAPPGGAVARAPGQTRAEAASVERPARAWALRVAPLNGGRLPLRVTKESSSMRGRVPSASLGRSPSAAHPQAATPAPSWNVPASRQIARPSAEQFAISAKLPPGWDVDARDGGRHAGPRGATMAHFFPSRSQPLRWMRPFSQQQVVGRLASRPGVPPSTLRASRPTMQAMVAPTISARQSNHTPAQARSDLHFSSLPRASGAPSSLQANREQPSTRLFESSRESARMHRASERFRRAKSSDATAIHASLPMHGLAIRRPVDLMWRVSPNGAGVAGDLPRHGASMSMPAASAESTAAAVHALTATPRTNDKPVVCATALDPVLANRLAEDVIRRIDHRVRIERERRGL